MKFGIFVPHQIPRPWFDGAEEKLFRDCLEQVELADRLGYDYVWGQEHHFLEEYSHSSAPEVYLAAMSARTERIRIGFGVMLMPPNYNPPARSAERVATLDLISGGRVEWGTGASSSHIELGGFRMNLIEKREMWAEAVRETARMLCMEPYPGYEGKYFSMPARNIVPKPVQKPHPPLWVACANRESVRGAAKLGIGALTFAFMDAAEARFWVEEYYETFKRKCRPIGQAVNPNIAVLSGFMCHEAPEVARSRAVSGAQFFAYGLAHFYRFGTHYPGKTNLWNTFQGSEPPTPLAGLGGIGSPDQLRDHFRKLEEVGIDQVILLQQAGSYQHEHICASLELFAEKVLPEFKERDAEREREKRRQLQPVLEEIQRRMPDLSPQEDIPGIPAYPIMAKQNGIDPSSLKTGRNNLSAALWSLNVGGIPTREQK